MISKKVHDSNVGTKSTFRTCKSASKLDKFFGVLVGLKGFSYQFRQHTRASREMQVSRLLGKQNLRRAFGSFAAPRPVIKNTPVTGRNSNTGLTVTVFGAYGFVGRYIVEEIGTRTKPPFAYLCCVNLMFVFSAQTGARVYVPFRGCEMEIRHLKPMFDLGQVKIRLSSLNGSYCSEEIWCLLLAWSAPIQPS